MKLVPKGVASKWQFFLEDQIMPVFQSSVEKTSNKNSSPEQPNYRRTWNFERKKTLLDTLEYIFCYNVQTATFLIIATEKIV